MRFMSFVCVVGLSLTVGLAACSKKDDAEKAQPSEQQAVSSSASSQNAKPAQTATSSSVNNKQAAAPVYVPAPLSEAHQQKLQSAFQGIMDQEVQNEFTCKNGTSFKAVFTNSPDTVKITFPGRVTVTLPRKQMQGVGFWYETPQYTLRGRGPYAKWIMKGRQPVDCEQSNMQYDNGK